MFRNLLLVIGAILVLSGVFLPVEQIAGRAIPSDILNDMETAGKHARIAELRQQFLLGLAFLRVALLLLGAWIVALGACWKRWAVFDGQESAGLNSNVSFSKELWMPAAWFLLVVVLSLPLLSKGFEHAEFLGYSMLAERGPLVTLACQNLPPRAGQIGFTVIESLFVKIFGSSETAARLPAIFAGAAAMFPLFLLARSFGSILFANMVCAGLGLTGFFLFYAGYARGYSLAMTSYLFCVLVAFRLRQRETWQLWFALGAFMILACYVHMASCVYIAALGVIIIVHRVIDSRKVHKKIADVAMTLVRPLVVLVSSVLVLFLLYSPTIPVELKYMRTFDLANYYMSYHLDARFVTVMVELWAWLRDCFPVALFQAALCTAGLIFGFKKKPWLAAYMVFPLLVSVFLIWFKHLFVYPRFFIHFLPFYVLLSVLAVFELGGRLRVKESTVSIVLAACLLVSAPFTLSKLYGMERCGARSAVEKVRSVMLKDDRVMAVLDGYITVRHYFPGVISGYRDSDFWREMRQEPSPEYVISVPYIEYDIPGASKFLDEKYSLVKKYPSWLDVDDDQDSVYLFRKKEFRSQ